MLVVTAEIWPGGDKSRAEVIGEICAANISSLSATSDYHVEISARGDELSGAASCAHAFQVLGHRRKKGVWELVRRIISQSRSHAQSEHARGSVGLTAAEDSRWISIAADRAKDGAAPTKSDGKLD